MTDDIFSRHSKTLHDEYDDIDPVSIYKLYNMIIS